MDPTPFDDVIRTSEELRRVYREPSELVTSKKIDHLDDGCASIIAASPLVMVATADDRGRCEVSPRGGPAGFVAVLDQHRLAIPDLSGNNLLDALGNVLVNAQIGLLFIIPGREETLRVGGRAWIVRDDAVLDGFSDELKRPRAAIGVQVERAFVHCAKSFRRSGAWDPASWSDGGAASAAAIFVEHLGLDATAEQVEADLELGYTYDLDDERVDGGAGRSAATGGRSAS